MVFVEGDATMSTYQDAEGKTLSSLNIVQRECAQLAPRNLLATLY